MQNPLSSQQKSPQNKFLYNFQTIIHSWQSRFPAWVFLLALILLGITLGMKNDLAYSDNRKVLPNPIDKSRRHPQNTNFICCQPNQQEVILLPHRILSSSPNTQGIQMKEDNISVNVKDQVAITTMDQSFVNTSKRTLEARYLFPLPDDANFSSFTLTINGKVVEGEVMEKNAARETYQQIVQKLIDPGLLEYIDAKTVQVSVAPILPGEVKKIHLSYTQLLKKDGGLYKYQYALGKEPSSLNPSPTFQNAENNYSKDYKSSLAVSLTTQQPLKTIYSPSHSPVIQRKGKNQASITLDLTHSQGGNTSSNNQSAFVLYFSEDQNLVSVNHLIYKKSATEDGYFLMTLRSPLESNPNEKIAKNLVLAIDTSGSMAGEKIQQARKALLYVLNHLQSEDHFNVVQFNTDVSSFRPELVPATHDNI
ncbi:MAG: VIT and VWA domain-containing protein, partial [Cyanobacteria bacterium]|nr:VIT and VWA domain-containing protein [Cyanobacteriota bacterium]